MYCNVIHHIEYTTIKKLMDDESLRELYSAKAVPSIKEYTKEQVLKLWVEIIEQDVK